MASPPVADPYLALGLNKDADQAQIKSVYRKLVLKCHPDKVLDEAKKKEASDVFHKIQQAYEILSDDDRRSRYDASVRLAALRQEVLQKQQHQYQHAPPPIRTEFRQQYYPPPSPARTHSFDPRPHSFDPRPQSYERSRSFYDPDEWEPQPPPRPTTRKTSYPEKESRKHAKNDVEKRAHAKHVEKAGHHDRKKHTDKDRRKERDVKPSFRPSVEDDSDGSDYQSPRGGSPRRSPRIHARRRSRDYHRRDHSPERERRRDPAPELSDTDTDVDPHNQKMRVVSTGIKDYIDRSNTQEHKQSRRPSLQPARNPTIDSLREVDGSARRSSVHNNGRDRHSSDRPEKIRQNSAPVTLNADVFDKEPRRPGISKSHTTPLVEVVQEKKSKNPARTLRYDVTGGLTALRRGESDPIASHRRPEMPRSHSKLSQHVDYEHGLPTPVASPPRSARHRSRADEDDDDDRRDRADSPRTTSSRRRPPSPERTKSSQSSRHDSAAGPKLAPPPLRVKTSGPQFAASYTDEPQSARDLRNSSPRLDRSHSSHAAAMFSPKIFGEYHEGKPKLPSRNSRDREHEVEVTDFEPHKMRTGGSGGRRRSTRPTTSRNNSYNVAV